MMGDVVCACCIISYVIHAGMVRINEQLAAYKAVSFEWASGRWCCGSARLVQH
jgi:hypothetical protein